LPFSSSPSRFPAHLCSTPCHVAAAPATIDDSRFEHLWLQPHLSQHLIKHASPSSHRAIVSIEHQKGSFLCDGCLITDVCLRPQTVPIATSVSVAPGPRSSLTPEATLSVLCPCRLLLFPFGNPSSDTSSTTARLQPSPDPWTLLGASPECLSARRPQLRCPPRPLRPAIGGAPPPTCVVVGRTLW
jgi:hypothetical protein